MAVIKPDAKDSGPSKHEILQAAHREMQRFNKERRQSLRRATGMDWRTLFIIVAIILLLCGLVIDITYTSHSSTVINSPASN